MNNSSQITDEVETYTVGHTEYKRQNSNWNLDLMIASIIFHMKYYYIISSLRGIGNLRLKDHI